MFLYKMLRQTMFQFSNKRICHAFFHTKHEPVGTYIHIIQYTQTDNKHIHATPLIGCMENNEYIFTKEEVKVRQFHGALVHF